MTDSPLILTNEVITMIQGGEFDDNLNQFTDAIRQRQKMISRYAAVTMKPGDKFYIRNISPKYLTGVVVEFVEYTYGIAPIRARMVYGAGGRYPAGRIINLREGHVGGQA